MPTILQWKKKKTIVNNGPRKPYRRIPICVTNINLRGEGIGKCKVHIVRNRPSWDKPATRQIYMFMIQRGKKYNYT